VRNGEVKGNMWSNHPICTSSWSNMLDESVTKGQMQHVVELCYSCKQLVKHDQAAT
jgi:hypothetical protein